MNQDYEVFISHLMYQVLFIAGLVVLATSLLFWLFAGTQGDGSTVLYN